MNIVLNRGVVVRDWKHRRRTTRAGPINKGIQCQFVENRGLNVMIGIRRQGDLVPITLGFHVWKVNVTQYEFITRSGGKNKSTHYHYRNMAQLCLTPAGAHLFGMNTRRNWVEVPSLEEVMLAANEQARHTGGGAFAQCPELFQSSRGPCILLWQPHKEANPKMFRALADLTLMQHGYMSRLALCMARNMSKPFPTGENTVEEHLSRWDRMPLLPGVPHTVIPLRTPPGATPDLSPPLLTCKPFPTWTGLNGRRTATIQEYMVGEYAPGELLDEVGAIATSQLRDGMWDEVSVLYPEFNEKFRKSSGGKQGCLAWFWYFLALLGALAWVFFLVEPFAIPDEWVEDEDGNPYGLLALLPFMFAGPIFMICGICFQCWSRRVRLRAQIKGMTLFGLVGDARLKELNKELAKNHALNVTIAIDPPASFGTQMVLLVTDVAGAKPPPMERASSFVSNSGVRFAKELYEEGDDDEEEEDDDPLTLYTPDQPRDEPRDVEKVPDDFDMTPMSAYSGMDMDNDPNDKYRWKPDPPSYDEVVDGKYDQFFL